VREYLPFIDDQNELPRFDGQRFVVLRPGGEVCDAFERVRRTIRDKHADLPISYIARAHVTLGGFPKGTRLESVQELARVWAPAVSSLRVEVKQVGFFVSPFQLLFLQVRKTPELLHALISLRSLAGQHGLRVADEVPVVDWTFHMSVGYCASLDSADWDAVTRSAATMAVPSAHCTVGEAEVAAFDDGREFSGGVYRLGA